MIFIVQRAISWSSPLESWWKLEAELLFVCLKTSPVIFRQNGDRLLWKHPQTGTCISLWWGDSAHCPRQTRHAKPFLVVVILSFKSLHNTQESYLFTESENILCWKGLTRIIKSKSERNGPYRDQTHNLGAIITMLLTNLFWVHCFTKNPRIFL